MTDWKTTALGLGMLMLAFSSGCRRGPVMVPVSGTIAYDGVAVDKGEILFQSDDPAIAPDAGPIVSGEFSFLAKPGDRKVQIRGLRQVRMTEMGPLMEEFIPTKFNSKTALTSTITPEGPNRFTFDLRSK